MLDLVHAMFPYVLTYYAGTIVVVLVAQVFVHHFQPLCSRETDER